MNKGMERFNYKREYDWLIISQSYFQSALMCARILHKQLDGLAVAEGSPEEFCQKEIYGKYPQDPVYLIFPILFNFKHGIELYLKAIIGMANNEFPKDHNSRELLEKSKIDNHFIEDLIEKYSFGKLLLPANKLRDSENTFERYPQGTPYDTLDLYSTVNDKGKKISVPNEISLDEYIQLLNDNNYATHSTITQDKVNELIKDIEQICKEIRTITLFSLKDKDVRL
jgi:hypothetical protein